MSFIHKMSNVAEVCIAEIQIDIGVTAHMHLSWRNPQKRRDIVIIGAGLLVTHDVQVFGSVVEEPARQTGWVRRAGFCPNVELVCSQTGEGYCIISDNLPLQFLEL